MTIAVSPTEIDIMAYNFGLVLGAASNGDDVSDERLDNIAKKIKVLLNEIAENRRNAEVACARFSAAIVTGRKAVRQGAIEEHAAEAALRQIELDLAGADL